MKMVFNIILIPAGAIVGLIAANLINRGCQTEGVTLLFFWIGFLLTYVGGSVWFAWRKHK